MRTLTLTNPAKIGASNKILEQIEAIEEYLENLKGELYWMPVRFKTRQDSIVEATAGILEKRSLNGVKYENSVRKEWSNRFKNL